MGKQTTAMNDPLETASATNIPLKSLGLGKFVLNDDSIETKDFYSVREIKVPMHLTRDKNNSRGDKWTTFYACTMLPERATIELTKRLVIVKCGADVFMKFDRPSGKRKDGNTLDATQFLAHFPKGTRVPNSRDVEAEAAALRAKQDVLRERAQLEADEAAGITKYTGRCDTMDRLARRLGEAREDVKARRDTILDSIDNGRGVLARDARALNTSSWVAEALRNDLDNLIEQSTDAEPVIKVVETRTLTNTQRKRCADCIASCGT